MHVVERYSYNEKQNMTKYLALFLCNFCQAAEINVASIDWCPQLCQDTERPGYIIDTIEMVFTDSPFELDIKTYPWSRSIKLVETGRKHALLSPAKNEAPNLVYPRNEVGIQRMCFFTLKNSDWLYKGVESLKGLRIGIATDASPQELTEYIKNNQHQFQYMPYHENYVEQSFNKLKKNRVDTFLFTYNSTIYKMKNIGVFPDYKMAGCVSSAKVYLAFSPQPNLNIKPMIDYFDERMDKIKASGALNNIMARYGLENWQLY